ncbi:MAG: sigma-70 family polymerase sigma factor [Ilumatobacteraceae bacterium]|nr:sigma-70 family polymerase sigma factor [Ilumatobacteraceae bacterium]
MDRSNFAVEQFEQHRQRLASIARRMLGSSSDADDAMQETWLRVERADTTGIDNVAGWLTTVTARICLNMLRSRRTRHADPLDVLDGDVYVDHADPERAVTLADSVSIALLLVLETLEPAERLAFVLHDLFAMPFDEIAAILERSPAATRQLASRARRRIHDHDPETASVRTGGHRLVVDAFFAAARGGSLDDLVALLDPDLVLRSVGRADDPSATTFVNGARQVAGRAIRFAQPEAELLPVVVRGSAGVLATVGARRISLMVFTVERDVITRIDVLVDPTRLRDLVVGDLR